MNPDVAAAVPELVRRGVLTPERAALPLRVARRELVSVRRELKWLLGFGVLLATTGVGLLVKESYDRLGPLAIALLLGLAAAGILAWVVRTAPPFSWGPVPSPGLAFDAMLVLGILVAAADLAFVEAQFTPLGAAWPWHLLLVSLATAVAAVRFDSRAAFALALSTFAAWRGVSVSVLETRHWWGEGAVALNAIGCGLLFVGLGALMKRTGRKPHFEPVVVHLGWLLILGGLAAQAIEGTAGLAWAAVLLAVGAALAAWSARARRFPLFAYGVLGAYAGLSRLAVEVLDDPTLGCAWFFVTAIAMIGGLIAAQRLMTRGEPR